MLKSPVKEKRRALPNFAPSAQSWHSRPVRPTKHYYGLPQHAALGRRGLAEDNILPSRDDYILTHAGPPPATERKADDSASIEAWNAYYSREYAARKTWDSTMSEAVSEGRIEPKAAEKSGWRDYEAHSEVGSQPLPAPLYHVTTAKSSVLENGLKSRCQLGQRDGKGLGAGSECTISFTTDLELAVAIKESILEARKVAREEITAQDLWEQAVKGEGARKPWAHNLVEADNIKDWTPGDPLPIHMQLRLQGRKWVRLSDIGHRPDWHLTIEGAPPEWEPIGEGTTDKDGLVRHYAWSRPLTPKERRDHTFDWYKLWLAYREYAGGRVNPVFMSTDTEGLANTPEEEIALFEAEPCPNAKGAQMDAMDEWRSYSGKAIRLTQVDGEPIQGDVARCHTGVTSGPPPKRLRYLYHGAPTYAVDNIRGEWKLDPETQLTDSMEIAKWQAANRSTGGKQDLQYQEFKVLRAPFDESKLVTDHRAFTFPPQPIIEGLVKRHPNTCDPEEDTDGDCWKRLTRWGDIPEPVTPEDSLRLTKTVQAGEGQVVKVRDIKIKAVKPYKTLLWNDDAPAGKHVNVQGLAGAQNRGVLPPGGRDQYISWPQIRLRAQHYDARPTEQGWLTLRDLEPSSYHGARLRHLVACGACVIRTGGPQHSAWMRDCGEALATGKAPKAGWYVEAVVPNKKTDTDSYLSVDKLRDAEWLEYNDLPKDLTFRGAVTRCLINRRKLHERNRLDPEMQQERRRSREPEPKPWPKNLAPPFTAEAIHIAAGPELPNEVKAALGGYWASTVRWYGHEGGTETGSGESCVSVGGLGSPTWTRAIKDFGLKKYKRSVTPSSSKDGLPYIDDLYEGHNPPSEYKNLTFTVSGTVPIQAPVSTPPNPSIKVCWWEKKR